MLLEKNLELISVYIEEYRGVKDLLINFSNKYTCVRNENWFEIKKLNLESEFYKNYYKGCNVKALLGVNSSGKTTVIDYIKCYNGDLPGNGFLIFESEGVFLFKQFSSFGLLSYENIKIEEFKSYHARNFSVALVSNIFDSDVYTDKFLNYEHVGGVNDGVIDLSTNKLIKTKSKEELLDFESEVEYEFFISDVFNSIFKSDVRFRCDLLKPLATIFSSDALAIRENIGADTFVAGGGYGNVHDFLTQLGYQAKNPFDADHEFFSSVKDITSTFYDSFATRYRSDLETLNKGFLLGSIMYFIARIKGLDSKEISFFRYVCLVSVMLGKGVEGKIEIFNSFIQSFKLKKEKVNLVIKKFKLLLESVKSFCRTMFTCYSNEKEAYYLSKISIDDDYISFTFSGRNRTLIDGLYKVKTNGGHGIKFVISNVSTGEAAKIKMLSKIYKVFSLLKTRDCILLIDEVDVYLHPEWQRDIVFDIILILINFKSKNIQCVLTTHSPIVVSDFLPKDIISLVRTVDSKVVVDEVNVCGFGSKISDLYLNTMQLNSIFGKLASEYIDILFDKKSQAVEFRNFLIEQLADAKLKDYLKNSL